MHLSPNQSNCAIASTEVVFGAIPCVDTPALVADDVFAGSVVVAPKFIEAASSTWCSSIMTTPALSKPADSVIHKVNHTIMHTIMHTAFAAKREHGRWSNPGSDSE